MRSALVVGSFMLAACDALFFIERVDEPPPADAPPDAPPDCSIPKAMTAECRDVELPLIADTYLDRNDPDVAKGGLDGIFVDAATAGLFKFDTSMIGAQEGIAAARFVVRAYNGGTGKACNAIDPIVCAACSTLVDGWSVHWAISSWTSLGATHTSIDTGTRWAMPGAAGVPDDRSALVASGPRPADITPMDLAISQPAIAATPPDCYIAENRLTVLFHIEGGGWFRSQDQNACSTQVPAKLHVTLCTLL